MEVTCLRHAESVFNRDNTSEKDCELTDVGIQQAEQITGEYDVIICSILKRCRQTLEHSNLNSKALHFTDLCREVRRDICDFLENEDKNNIETDAQIYKRLQEFKEFLKEKVTPEQKVLVISHRDFIHELAHRNGPLLANAESVTIQLD